MFGPGVSAVCPAADLDASGTVDLRDYVEFQRAIDSETHSDPADINRDGTVDGKDVGHIVHCVSRLISMPGCLADLNADGKYDLRDFVVFQRLYPQGLASGE